MDEMFEKASYNDEPEDMNFIKKHTAALAAKGVERPFSRLFSNPPGDYHFPLAPPFPLFQPSINQPSSPTSVVVSREC